MCRGREVHKNEGAGEEEGGGHLSSGCIDQTAALGLLCACAVRDAAANPDVSASAAADDQKHLQMLYPPPPLPLPSLSLRA